MSTAAGVPASIFQSINPIYIILLGAALRLAVGGSAGAGWSPRPRPSSASAWSSSAPASWCWSRARTPAGIDGLTPVIFIFLIYLLHTTGELCLSPVGLSAMNRLAPAHMASLIMGTWFLSPRPAISSPA